MTPDDTRALIAALARAVQPFSPAEDDEPTVDPMQTRGKAPGARVGMDSSGTKGLFQRFPEIARIGRAF